MTPTLKQLKKQFVLQQGHADCGVACLLSLMHFHGGTNTLENLRRLSGTNIQGTTLLGLYQAAQQLGFDASGVEASLEALMEHEQPVILHVVIDGKLPHYVICYGYQDDHFLIGDPAKGIAPMTAEALAQIWVDKKCLLLSPNANFTHKKTLAKSKNAWLTRLIKADAQLLGITLVLGVLLAVLSMAMAVFSQKLIDDILPDDDTKLLLVGLVLFGAIIFIQVLLRALRQLFLLRQSKDFNNRIIDHFYKTLLFLPKAFFDTRKIGELVARLNDTSRIQRVVSQIAGTVIIDALMLVVSLAFLFSYSPVAGSIAALCLPCYFLIVYRFNRKIIAAQQRVMQGYAHNESNFISTLKGISIIKNFNQQHTFSATNRSIYGNYQEQVYALGQINIKLGLVSGISGIVFLLAILSYTAFQVQHDVLKTGELMAVVGISSALFPAIANLAAVIIPINEAKIAFDRMFEFVQITPEIDAPIQTVQLESLAFRQVSFRFPGRKQILKEVSLEVNKNEVVSIVGESGSGKSTIGQIMQQFYTPESGSILLNGDKLEPTMINSLRNRIGVVPQDIHIFNGNVFNNIALDEAPERETEMREFCQALGFTPFIEALPQGFYTILGEEGINLSGGQKQLIALMRALFARPQLLILDEATSAMDRFTERFVLNLLQQLKPSLAVVFISHRLHILKAFSDRIYVLEKGQVLVSGNHKEVLQTDNLYSDYWREIAESNLQSATSSSV